VFLRNVFWWSLVKYLIKKIVSINEFVKILIYLEVKNSFDG